MSTALHAASSDLGQFLDELGEVDKDSLRGAFARRALRAVLGLSQELAEASLKEAVAAPSDYGVLLAALETEPGLLLLNRDDPLARARLRGLAARRQLLEQEGGTLTAQEAANHLRISRQAVHKRVRGGRLLALDCGRHGYIFPAWQFTDEGVLPGLEDLLAALADHDPWMKLAFFLGENTALDGSTPLEALRRQESATALRAARLYGEQGAV